MKKKERVGIILAAGFGSRLHGHTDRDIPKPLMVIAGQSLLMRTIHSHELAHIKKIIIVTGWQSDLIKKEILSQYKGPAELHFILNEQFELKNGISVLKAKLYVESDFLLTMADHILDDKMMVMARNHIPPEGGATLCVDYKIETIFDLPDATKVMVKDGLIQHVGKELKTFNAIDTGVFIGTLALMEKIEDISTSGGDASLSDGVQALAEEGKMVALDIGVSYWQDVDDSAMIQHARKLLK